MSPSAGRIELRPPRRSDAPAILRTLRRSDPTGASRADEALGDVLEELDAIGAGVEARVAERLGEVVGYAVVRSEGSRCAVTAGDEAGDAGQAILTRLLDFCEAHERADRREVHRQWVPTGAATVRAVLLDRGYAVARAYHVLSLALPAAPAGDRAADDPALAIEPLDPERDAADLHRIDDAAFRDRPDYVPETPATFAAGHLRGADLDRRISAVARREGRAVGFALVHRRGPAGVAHVRLLAVDPADQGNGVGTRLLGRVFAEAGRAGLAEVTLSVASDNPGGRRFYERLGMRECRRADVMERPTDDG